MRKSVAVSMALVASVLNMPVAVFAASDKPAILIQGQTTGALQGVAKDAAQKNLSGIRVQVRTPNGQLAATGTTNSTGQFSFVGLNPGSYTLEIVDAAGNIVGTSAAVTVTAGATATITVTAAAAGAIAAAAGGGVSLFGLGTIGTVAVVGGAAAATVATIAATQNNASPSR